MVIPQGRSDHRVCAFSSDGASLFIGNAEGQVFSFDSRDFSKGPVLQWEAHSLGVSALALCGDGKTILTGGDSSIRVWDLDRLEKPRLTVPTESSPSWLQLCNDDSLLFHLNQLGTIESLLLLKP